MQYIEIFYTFFLNKNYSFKCPDNVNDTDYKKTKQNTHTVGGAARHHHILFNSSTWSPFKGGAFHSPERGEWDEGHGSGGEGEEDGLEDGVPPFAFLN